MRGVREAGRAARVAGSMNAEGGGPLDGFFAALNALVSAAILLLEKVIALFRTR